MSACVQFLIFFFFLTCHTNLTGPVRNVPAISVIRGNDFLMTGVEEIHLRLIPPLTSVPQSASTAAELVPLL